MECWKCGKKGFDSKKSLRGHQIGANEYDKKEFDEKYEKQRKQEDDSMEENAENHHEKEISNDEDKSKQEIEEDNKQLNEDSNDEKESVELKDVSGGMDETDLDKLVEESQVDGDDEDSSTDSGSPTEKKGLDTAINNAWGRIATIDLDPDADETTNMRKNIKGLAEDVGLGQNAKWYYEEELKGDTDDPKKAVMGSLLLATVMTLSVRPELAQKIQRELKNKKSTTNKNKELEDKDKEE